MNNQVFDLIVIGAGGMGSAITAFAAQKNLQVLCLEQFSQGHQLGSSHGQTRAIRQAYFEKEAYVPFCKRSYKLWLDLESKLSEELMVLNGILLSLPPTDSKIKDGLLKSARQYNIELQFLSKEEVQTKWPVLTPQTEYFNIFEPHAGFLYVEKCVEGLIKWAKQNGAQFEFNTAVKNWTSKNDIIHVETDNQIFQGKKLALAGGPWNRDLLQDLNLNLKVHRVQSGWFPPQNNDSINDYEKLPVWATETHGEFIYGFPMLDRRGIKTAWHFPGKEVSHLQQIDRSYDPEDAFRLGKMSSSFISNLDIKPSDTQVCLYTMTPDEDFLIDYHPQNKNIIVVAGFSGHGFKFSPAIGEYVCQMLLEEEQELDGSLFKWRPSLLKNEKMQS